MKTIFEELVKGNLPGKENEKKKEEFTIKKGKRYYFLYKNGNPLNEQLVAFNINDAKSEKVETRCKQMFRTFGYTFNDNTREWHK